MAENDDNRLEVRDRMSCVTTTGYEGTEEVVILVVLRDEYNRMYSKPKNSILLGPFICRVACFSLVVDSAGSCPKIGLVHILCPRVISFVFLGFRP